MYVVGHRLCICCVVLRLCGHFGLDTACDVRPEMLPQMVLAVEAFSALLAHVFLLAGMNDDVQRELFLALEALHTNLKENHKKNISFFNSSLLSECEYFTYVANMRTIRNVR